MICVSGKTCPLLLAATQLTSTSRVLLKFVRRQNKAQGIILALAFLSGFSARRVLYFLWYLVDYTGYTKSRGIEVPHNGNS